MLQRAPVPRIPNKAASCRRAPNDNTRDGVSSSKKLIEIFVAVLMSFLKKISLSALALCLLIFFSISGLLYYQATHPVGTNSTTVAIEIKPRMTLKQVANHLANNELILSATSFRLLAYIGKKRGRVQAGEYELSPSMLPLEILKKINSGQTIKYPVTIPEGYRITEIATLFAQKGLADKNKLIQLARDHEFIESLGVHANTLEGYLFPETYHFSKAPGEHVILKAMVDTFKKNALTPERIQRAEELNLSINEIITLASLIEKETGQDTERELISSVFHNRLQKNMKLQTDPTVIYALEDFDGNIRKKDLSIDSPYNTYKYSGLPPGPIANPGLKSILAAIYPAQTDYLYFVSKNNGSHLFSTNLIDHNHAVTQYQLKKSNKS